MPSYVRACRDKRWHIATWKYDTKTGELFTPVDAPRRTPFRCRSWRHDGECRRWRAAQNYSRVYEALCGAGNDSVSFVVLTLDPSQWKSRFDAFRELRERWRPLMKALRRTFQVFDEDGKLVEDVQYVSTVEVHRSGWPHLNVIIVSKRFAQLVARGSTKKSGPGHAWLVKHARACGFGYLATCETAKSRGAVAGYCVKLAGNVEQAAEKTADGRLVGEAVKFSQVPEEAPAHFRRIRSSVRFLPPPMKFEGITGELVKRPPPDASASNGEQGSHACKQNCSGPSASSSSSAAPSSLTVEGLNDVGPPEQQTLDPGRHPPGKVHQLQEVQAKHDRQTLDELLRRHGFQLALFEPPHICARAPHPPPELSKREAFLSPSSADERSEVVSHEGLPASRVSETGNAFSREDNG